MSLRAYFATRCLQKYVGKVISTSTCRHASSSDKLRNPTVVLSKDGSTIMCWHPEPSFPYEHTQALPRREPELREGDSVLKVQYLLDAKHARRSDGPTDAELMDMFSTAKYQWRLIPRKRFAKPNPPKDREGI